MEVQTNFGRRDPYGAEVWEHRLRELRASITDAPEEVVALLARFYSATTDSTVGLVLVDTDVEGDSRHEPTLEVSPRMRLTSMLANDAQLTHLAQLLAESSDTDLKNAIQNGLPAGSEAAPYAATRVMSSPNESSGEVAVGDLSGFGLGSLPGAEADSDSFSFQAINHDDVLPAGEGITIGNLEDTFKIRVDDRGRPVVLGKGGMGYVVIGEPRSGGAPLAIKVCSDSKHEPRMLREFEILRELNCEGFPGPAGGLYRDQQGHLCYAMKLVQGESYLAGYKAFHQVARDPQTNDEHAIKFIDRYLLVERPEAGFKASELSQIFAALVDRFIDVATAVSTMHRKGFIHRDLKPENVRIESDTRHAIILDFGLAKVQEDTDLFADTQELSLGSSMQANLTRVGNVMGTFAYMSPEQASGDPNAHTMKTDIYALGAMLYYLITGRSAVAEHDQNGNARNVHQVLKQIREGAIEPPVRLSAIRADFADLEAICSKAIATVPEKRYGSVDEMIIDLRAWAAGNPVKAYRDTVTGTARLKYDFHHWKKQNTGLWNQAVTAALAVFTAGGGAGAYFMNENAKAGRAAVTAERSLSTLTTEVNKELAKYIGGYEVQDLKALPVEKLDLLVAGGNFDVNFRTFLKKTLEELRTKVLQEDDVLSYRGYGVVADIYREATELESRLTDIESLFEARVKNRELVRAEVEEFRKEFAPIRDFLGNDFEAVMSDAPQGRIDKALARYLPSFRDAGQQEGQEKLFFPECSQEVSDFLLQIESTERSRDEVQEIKAGVATLLSYKVLNLQRTASTGFAPHVKQFVPVGSRYLEDARRLRGGDPSVGDLILWERVAAELKDPRAEELRSKINTITEEVLQQEGAAQRVQLSSQDLGMLAGGLMERHRHADAIKLFEKILDVRSAEKEIQAAALPSRYLGQVGRGVCKLNLAIAAIREKRIEDAKKHLIDAADAFSIAKGILSSLPDDSADKRAKLGIIYLGIARTHGYNWMISKDPVQVAEMKAAHAAAQRLIDGPRLFHIIASDLFNLDDHEGAEVWYSKVIDAAPYAANLIRPMRAFCYAYMLQESKMLGDIEAVLANAKIEIQGGRVYPQELIGCAKALGAYILMHDMNPELYSMSESKRQEYLERMKEVFLEVERLCASGAPCTEGLLDLNSELYQPLKESDPEFWGEWRSSTLSHLPPTTRSK